MSGNTEARAARLTSVPVESTTHTVIIATRTQTSTRNSVTRIPLFTGGTVAIIAPADIDTPDILELLTKAIGECRQHDGDPYTLITPDGDLWEWTTEAPHIAYREA